MKAILLAGGKGSRLRPLTLHTPKPIVPIFDRPFLQYQIDLLRQVPEIDEIVLSLNYQPRRIEEVFGDGSDLGLHLRYVVEPTPLGTGGAIKFAAGESRGEPIVVFNGDNGQFLYGNQHACALYGVPMERLATLTPADVSPEFQPGGRRSSELAREKMEEALAAFQSLRPHIVLSDIGLPGHDGYELISQLRALPGGQSVPAVALTALARSEDRTRALRAGFQMHVPKPVETSELVAVVRNLANLQSRQD